MTLKLPRICDTDEKYDGWSEKYQKYLIAREYHPDSLKKYFDDVRNMSGSDAWTPKM